MEEKLDSNAELGPASAIPDNVSVFDSGCYGCQRSGTSVMLSFTVSKDPRRENEPTFYDMLLSKEQARDLLVKLDKVVERELRGTSDEDFLRHGSGILHVNVISRADFSRIEDLECSLWSGDREFKFTGLDALEAAMRLQPSALEGRRLLWPKFAWAVHNLIGHPLMQILAFFGAYRLAMKVHERTIPRPRGARTS